MTTRFYGAQRSGHGPNWLIADHEPTDVPDYLKQYTKNFVKGKSFIKDADVDGYDLTGGWFDCGDHVKFGQTEFYSAYMLILGYSEFPEGYDDFYSFNYEGYIKSKNYTWEGKEGKPNGIPDILDEVKYATDYFQKVIRDKNTFYYQVGEGGSGADHKNWVTSSFKSALPRNEGGEADGSRPVHKTTEKATTMVSLCGATLAAMARLYKPFDPAYADSCLKKALVCYDFVDRSTKGNIGDAQSTYYNDGANKKYAPDIAIFFAELYRTTNDSKYLIEAEDAASFIADASGWNHNYSLCWNNTEDLAFYLMAVTNSKLAEIATTRLKYYVETLYKPTSGYFLNKMNGDWGILRFPANQAFVYALYDKLVDIYKSGDEKTMNPYTLASVEYIMGRNTGNFSFITGFGANSPKLPHHRNYFGSDANNMNGLKTQDIQLGYMVGGRLNPGDFEESLTKFEHTEGGIDYNAGLVGALGYINSILNPVNINQFGHPTPKLGDDVSICGAGSIVLDSKVPADGKKTFTWKRNGTQLVSNTTASTYSATEAGEYTCEIDSAGQWTTSGSVNVLGILPQIDLGEEITLCNPAQVTLNADVTGDGITYQWYVDGVKTDATGATYEVYKAGTYKCEISATGCSSTSDEVEVTSKLPVVADAISDKNGKVTLTVNGTGSYEWYENSEGGEPLHTGNSFTTTISQNTTYYVQDAGAVSLTTGPTKTTFTVAPSSWGSESANFTAKQSFQITGLTIMPTDYSSGETITIALRRDSKEGATIREYTSNNAIKDGDYWVVTFPEPIQIPEAGNFALVQTKGITPAFYEAGPAYSTYVDATASQVIEFTGSSNSTGANSFPGMLNWIIESGSGCARALAKAIYDPDNGGVGIEEQQPNGICSLYPNPVKDVVYLNLDCNSWSAGQEVRIEILSALGSPVKNIMTTVEGVASGINLSELQQGIYLIRIISGNSVSIKQIIKK